MKTTRLDKFPVLKSVLEAIFMDGGGSSHALPSYLANCQDRMHEVTDEEAGQLETALTELDADGREAVIDGMEGEIPLSTELNGVLDQISGV